jgi:hypothetical protein
MHRICEICKVGAYGSAFDQHMAGKKHAAKASQLARSGGGGGGGGGGGVSGVCFAFQRGQCFKSSCTYRHEAPSRQPLQPTAQRKAAGAAPPSAQQQKRRRACDVCFNDGEWCEDCGGGGAEAAKEEAAKPPENPGRARRRRYDHSALRFT